MSFSHKAGTDTAYLSIASPGPSVPKEGVGQAAAVMLLQRERPFLVWKAQCCYVIAYTFTGPH